MEVPQHWDSLCHQIPKVVLEGLVKVSTCSVSLWFQYSASCLNYQWDASFFCTAFHTGLGKESREITLQNAKKAITNLAHQLTGYVYV